MRVQLAFAALLALAFAAPSAADDFVSDLANCAKAPLKAASFAAEDGQKAVSFVVDHGECVPLVVSGDPLLYGTTAGFFALQAAGKLPSSHGACVDATLGQASRPVAQVLKEFVNTPPLASLLPASGKQKLVQIAHGEIKDGLYSVPGIALVAERLDCSCAVTSSGLNIAALKARIKDVVSTAGSCKKVLDKLLGGAYGAAEDFYSAGKEAVNDIGCALGIGGCSSGPPFFCTGYVSARDNGVSHEILAATIFGASFPDKMQKCKAHYAGVLAERHRKALEAAEKKLFEEEMAKATQLGGANALGFALRWGKKCLDQQCKTSLAKLADQYTAELNDPGTIEHYKYFGVALAATEKKYGAFAELAVAMSKKRVQNDSGAPADLRLRAFDCSLYFSRDRQSLCPTSTGVDACRPYVNGGEWDACVRTGQTGIYSAGPVLGRLLRDAGCIPALSRNPVPGMRSKPQAQCLSARAKTACDAFVRGGSNVVCHGGERTLSLDVRRWREELRAVPRDWPGRVEPPVHRREFVPVEPRPAPPPAFDLSPAMRRAFPQRQSTICLLDWGPRAGERHDLAPMASQPPGTPCRDGRGSTGRIVSP